MNKVFLVGNLTRDPEVSTTNSGISYCRFSIAVNRRFASADGTREADFLNIVCWRGLAENCGKYLKKGRKVAVSGSIQTRTYEAQDNTKRTATEIVADDVEFLTPMNATDSGTEFTPASPVSELKPIEDDELPF